MTPAAIDAYLGKGEPSTPRWSGSLGPTPRQNQHDHAQLVDAIRDGGIDSAPGW